MFSSCGSEIYQELTFHSPHVSKFSFPVRVLSTKFTKLLQDGENETENATNTIKKRGMVTYVHQTFLLFIHCF